jgi:methyl coenzyme M reductase alpha subunit
MGLETDLGKVGHAFVVGSEKLKAALLRAENLITAAAPEIAIVENVINNVVDEIYPGAGKVSTAIELGMSKVFSAVDAAGAAAGANGLSVTLDDATVIAIKAALPLVKAQAQSTPGA